MAGPCFGRVNPQFSDVILLKNTDKGNTWMVTTEVERPFPGRMVRDWRLLLRAVELGERHHEQHRAVDVDQRLHGR